MPITYEVLVNALNSLNQLIFIIGKCGSFRYKNLPLPIAGICFTRVYLRICNVTYDQLSIDTC